MRPFWRYYGGKWRNTPHYPAPLHDTIIEPFAGAAGYSTRYHRLNVILIDKSPIIAGIWRYLINVKPEEVLAIPDIPEGGTVDDLPCCQEAKWLAGFWCNNATVNPCKTNSKWARDFPEKAGWSHPVRKIISKQVPSIRHWRIIEGDYTDAPDIEATWMIDPPYSTKAGSYYQYQPGSFQDLGKWSETRKGQVIVCEQEGATWLPFQPLGTFRSAPGNRPERSNEVVWLKGCGQERLFDGVE